MAHISDITLVLLHLPELAFTMNRNVNALLYYCDPAIKFKRNIEMLRPENVYSTSNTWIINEVCIPQHGKRR